jgi:type VI secretion system secreted protein VgrG
VPVEINEIEIRADVVASQDKRVAVLTTPLGKDALLLARVEAVEGLSELFEFRIEALSDQDQIDFDKVIGHPAHVELRSFSDQPRYFHGIAVEAEALGAAGRRYAYRLVLRPWLWLLSHRTNCRIFDKTVVASPTAPEIIKKVFQDAGFSDFRDGLGGGAGKSYPELEYCVQYRETDLAFVSRLMEENGIYYFFEHAADKHTLVLADSPSAHKPVPGLASIRFAGPDEQRLWGEERLWQWTSGRRHRTGKVTLNDYDYLQPTAKLLSESEKPASYGLPRLEAYDYPGRFEDAGEGERLAKVRVEAAQAVDYRRYANGESPNLVPGGIVTLADHPVDDGDYLVVRCTHNFSTEAYETSGDGGGETWAGHYEFQPKDRQFRAPPLTPKPVIFGPQTAKVVGKQGEEIDVDEHGRILVQFYWDRDKRPSRRVRVAQMWSGKTWGGQFIPRINMEVVVEHLDGDPDRPLVVGTVYNADNKYPYDMPDKKNRAGIKSESTKNGSGHYNELYFDDTKGSEEIHMQAERDHTVLIKNSETATIGTIFETPQGSPSRSTTIKNGDDQLAISQGHQTVTLDAGNQTTTLKMGNQTTELKMGNQATKVDLGKIDTEAMQSIELKVGQSSVKLDQMGVTIKGMMIKIEGTVQVDVKAVVTNVGGDAMLVLKGGLTMIN